MANARSVEGVGGWLALLVVTIGVLTPLAQVGSVLALLNADPLLRSRYGDNWPIYSALLLIISGVRAVLCLFVARQLMYAKVSSTPQLAIIGIWVALGLLGVISLTIFGIFNPGPVAFGAMAERMFWPLVICAVATTYLLKSERVANTYSRGAEASASHPA